MYTFLQGAQTTSEIKGAQRGRKRCVSFTIPPFLEMRGMKNFIFHNFVAEKVFH